MKKLNLLLAALASTALLYTPFSQAESLVDGVYQAEGDARGTGKCILTIKSIDNPSNQYGDDTFELESSGEGSCEWSAVGMSKNFAITGGLITSGGTTAFVKLTFPFGPAGKRMELTALDLDGSVRNIEIFQKLDENVQLSE